MTFIRLRELTIASCQSMAHIAIYVNLYTRIRVRVGWLVVLRLNVPVNNFSVMSGRSHRFLGN